METGVGVAWLVVAEGITLGGSLVVEALRSRVTGAPLVLLREFFV